MRNLHMKHGLLATTAVAALVAAGSAAQAQQAGADGTAIQEVVVTATRQSDTVHNIPLTINAITDKELGRQSLRIAADLVRVVPALRISAANSGGAGVGGSSGANADIAVRGIRSAVNGTSATTGIYIDDVPLQQRTISSSGGGVALPMLFDLERVEVLKGPQGTLYGGSSEGGTIRFITQQPSLTRQSLYIRGEGSSTKDGAAGGEFGVTMSGPVIADKLAVKLSGYYRHDGGNVDHVSQYTGAVLAGGKDTNSANHLAFHGALLWRLTDRASATFSYIFQNEKYRDTDNYWENIPQYQANVGPAPGALYTYGPFNMFGPYRSGLNTNIGKNFYTSDAQLRPELTPHSQRMLLPSLTIDYAFDKMNFKSVTAYTETTNASHFSQSYADVTGQGKNIRTAAVASTIEGPYNALPANSPYIANLPVFNAESLSGSFTNSLSQEFRFSSNDPASPLSWVGGFFFNYLRTKAFGNIDSNLDDLTAAILFGRSQFTPRIRAFASRTGLNETQLAAYGDATYKITESLRLTGGLRVSRDNFNYQQLSGGALFGLAPGIFTVAAQGAVTSSAVTPKIGLQYVVNPNTNFYVSATKGYRPGGINATASPACNVSAQAAGYGAGVPTTFTDDSLWSYEGGAKIRALGGKASINASLFRIDWKGVQTLIALGCGAGGNFAINAASLVSQGVDFDGSIVLLPGFTVSLRGGYTDAHYTAAVKTPAATLINNNDRVLYTPKWQGDLAAEYRFGIGKTNAFVRADYSYQSSVMLSYSAGTFSYSPDNVSLPSASRINARIGLTVDKLEFSAFVDNLTNSQDLLFRGGFSTGPGRVNCQSAACTTYDKLSEGSVVSTFRPRTVGVTMSYRY